MTLDEHLRAVGFTAMARDFPRDEVGLAAIAAWIGCTVEQLPEGARYYPNAATKAAWERVYDAVLEENMSKNLRRDDTVEFLMQEIERLREKER